MCNRGSHVQFVLNVVWFVVILCVVLPPTLKGTQGPGEPAGDMRYLTGERGGRETRRLRATFPSTPAAAPRRRSWPPFHLQPAFFAHGAWTKRTWTGARLGTGTRACGPGPPGPPHRALAAAAWPRPGSPVVPPRRPGLSGPPPAAGLGQHRLCPAPLVGLLPGVLRL